MLDDRIDVMVLGAGHSILASQLPEALSLSNFNEKFFEANHKSQDDLAKFGLFGGSNNYSTYYPNAKKEDFTPNDDEFIEPVYRMLSACVVAKPYNPTEFSEKVLKDSMDMLIGQTINCDHETDIANAIGSVKSVSWQESYTADDGTVVPAGINGVFRIDAKSNPRIARGINMNPPSIHSNSVTVRFKWNPSHQFKDDFEFYKNLGTYAKDGQLVRKIATEIISYMETSLVSRGADPFAQKIVNGKIVNPTYAGKTYEAFKDLSAEDVAKHFYFCDFKSLEKEETMKNSYVESPIIKSNNMDELIQFVEQLFGPNLLTLKEGEEATKEVALSQIQNLISENQRLSEESAQSAENAANLQKEIDSLKEKISSSEKMAVIGTNYYSDVKKSAVESYRKLMGEKVDETILALLESETTSIETLISLKNSYDAQLEEKFPLHCHDCGSKNIDRASSVEEPKDVEENQENFSDNSVGQSIANIASKKLK